MQVKCHTCQLSHSFSQNLSKDVFVKLKSKAESISVEFFKCWAAEYFRCSMFDNVSI